jgi:hypothetical protein
MAVQVSIETIRCLCYDGNGLCLECGAESGSIEPDASNAECEICGAMAVFGGEELLFAEGVEVI